MIGYLMVGTNDLARSVAFYDALLSDLNAVQAFETDRFVAWTFGDGTTMFGVTKPFDDNPATGGNGTMVALAAKDTDAVDALHAKALSLGGTNEGDPGLRGDTFYGAYFRDFDGNKLALFCFT